MPPVSVIVVNYNAGASLVRCLDALADQTIPHSVQIIDNASEDDSARRAHSAHPGIPILPLRRNVGFARAVNIAAERVAGDEGILVTLNPDTVVQPDFLERLTAPFAQHTRLGAAAGTLVFASNPAVVASSGIDVFRNGVALDSRLGERITRDCTIEPVFGASGGAAAYRLSAFRQLAGFCEPFFMYLEDVDLAWRLRLSGWDAVRVPNAIATHEYSAAAGEGSAFKRRLLARNRIWTLARCLPSNVWHRDRRHILLFDLQAVGFSVARADRAALRGRAEGVAALPMRLRERSRIHCGAVVGWQELDRWLLPPISSRRLLRLRNLTATLASGGDHWR